MSSLQKLAGTIRGVALVFFTVGWSDMDVVKKNDTEPATHTVPTELKAEAKNAEDLIKWIRARDKQTEFQREASFEKLKGKNVVFRGEVRDVGTTAFSGETYVSLKVARLNMFENINIQFNVPASLKPTVSAWSKGEIHVMKGRIEGTGDLEDDAMCVSADIVSEEEYRKNIF